MESITKHFIYMEISEAPVLIHIFFCFSVFTCCMCCQVQSHSNHLLSHSPPLPLSFVNSLLNQWKLDERKINTLVQNRVNTRVWKWLHYYIWVGKIGGSVVFSIKIIKSRLCLYSSSTTCCQWKQECREGDDKGEEKQDKGETRRYCKGKTVNQILVGSSVIMCSCF